MLRKNQEEVSKPTAVETTIVYHYCSLETLYSILASRSLWLTSLKSSNDKKELMGDKPDGLKKILESIRDKKDSESLDDIYIINGMLASLTRQDYIQYTKEKKTENYYGTSFSFERDRLSQWERYGDNGKGACIAVNARNLVYDSYIRHNLIPFFNNWLRGSEVYYSKKEQEKYVKERLMKSVIDLNKSMPMQKLQIIPTYMYDMAIANLLLEMKMFFKNDGFCEEKEFRLVFMEKKAHMRQKRIADDDFFAGMAKRTAECLKDIGLCAKDKKHGIIGGAIRSYYAINLREIWNDDTIKEIILGPKCVQNKKELKSFLSDSSLGEVKISISKIPIR